MTIYSRALFNILCTLTFQQSLRGYWKNENGEKSIAYVQYAVRFKDVWGAGGGGGTLSLPSYFCRFQ